MTPLIVLLPLISLLPAQPDRFGTPACSAPDHELAERTYFTLCYDGSTRTATWLGYELTPQRLAAIAERPTHFRRDTGLSLPSASDSDYRHSGFHRGHLAPARDFAWDRQAMRATFLLSNAVPQYPAANNLSAQLESAIRRLAAQSEAIYVFTGSIFNSADPQRIGANRVAVPSHTFKVVLALQNGSLSMCAAIVPNSPAIREPLASFMTTVNEVQRRTALDFFASLADDLEGALESRLQPCLAQ